MKKVFFAITILASMVGLLQAAPFQTLGLLRTPDAYVLPHKAAELVLVGYYRDVVRPDYVNDDQNGLIPYGMIGVGILDRVELGFFGGDDVYFMNAKVKVIQETASLPQISVGMDNIFSPVNKHRAQDYDPIEYPDIEWADHPDKVDYEYYSPYVVASKQAVLGGVSWMFNLGWGNNRYTGQVPRSRFFNGIFSSIELSPFKDFAFQGEYDGKDFNAGLKYTFDNFTLRLGAEAVEDWAKGSEGNGYEDNVRVAFGISYLFDKYAEAKRRPDLRQYARETGTGETGIVTDDEIAVEITEPDTEVSIVTPGTTTQTPGIVESSTYRELSPEVKDLLAELRNLREERQKAQKALEDLRTWLQELQEQNQ